MTFQAASWQDLALGNQALGCGSEAAKNEVRVLVARVRATQNPKGVFIELAFTDTECLLC